MKKTIVNLFLIFSFAVSVIALSYSDAIAKTKPTVLYIYAPMCSACVQFGPTFNAAQAKFSQKFDFVKEDINSSQRAKSLNVSETPSVFILQQNNSQKIDWQCLSQTGCFEQKLKDYQ